MHGLLCWQSGTSGCMYMAIEQARQVCYQHANRTPGSVMNSNHSIAKKKTSIRLQTVPAPPLFPPYQPSRLIFPLLPLIDNLSHANLQSNKTNIYNDQTLFLSNACPVQFPLQPPISTVRPDTTCRSLENAPARVRTVTASSDCIGVCLLQTRRHDCSRPPTPSLLISTVR